MGCGESGVFFELADFFRGEGLEGVGEDFSEAGVVASVEGFEVFEEEDEFLEVGVCEFVVW